jgi:predicted ribosomally synthesized peptide with nif11-like leader
MTTLERTLQLAQSDREFIGQLQTATQDEALNLFVNYGTQQGFNFTEAEIRQTLNAPNISSELSERELEVTLGAASGQTNYPICTWAIC